jgi:hypothetical protein
MQLIQGAGGGKSEQAVKKCACQIADGNSTMAFAPGERRRYTVGARLKDIKGDRRIIIEQREHSRTLELAMAQVRLAHHRRESLALPLAYTILAPRLVGKAFYVCT